MAANTFIFTEASLVELDVVAAPCAITPYVRYHATQDAQKA